MRCPVDTAIHSLHCKFWCWKGFLKAVKLFFELNKWVNCNIFVGSWGFQKTRYSEPNDRAIVALTFPDFSRYINSFEYVEPKTLFWTPTQNPRELWPVFGVENYEQVIHWNLGNWWMIYSNWEILLWKWKTSKLGVVSSGKLRNTLIDSVVDVGQPSLPPQVLTGLWTADDRRLGLGCEDQTVQIYGIVEFLALVIRWPLLSLLFKVSFLYISGADRRIMVHQLSCFMTKRTDLSCWRKFGDSEQKLPRLFFLVLGDQAANSLNVFLLNRRISSIYLSMQNHCSLEQG